MVNILIFTNKLPYPLDNGNALRVFNLSKELSKVHICYLASFDINKEQLNPLKKEQIFQEIHLLPSNKEKKRLRRHIRLSEKRFIQCSTPKYFNIIVNEFETLIDRYNIHLIYICHLELLEYVKDFHNVRKILDDCDCKTLTIERKYRRERANLSLIKKFKELLRLYRSKNLEKNLGTMVDIITTVSPVDKARLQELNPKFKEKIKLLPNGVAPELVKKEYKSQEIPNSIIFWGNLDFEPNYTAVEYFYQQIFLPYLKDKDIKWYIVGGNPPNTIIQMGKEHENIIVTGYKDDLFEFASHIPIMINPMVMGSGLKNKVLEAFALKRLVISNSMGIEGIFGPIPGEHYIHAESPKEFAEAIFYYLKNTIKRNQIGEQARKLVIDKYTWDKIGNDFMSIIDSLIK